jgi:hypothetical protein
MRKDRLGWYGRDIRSSSTPGGKVTLLIQDPVGSRHGIKVNVQVNCYLPHGRQPRSLCELSDLDEVTHFLHDLLAKRNVRSKINPYLDRIHMVGIDPLAILPQ